MGGTARILLRSQPRGAHAPQEEFDMESDDVVYADGGASRRARMGLYDQLVQDLSLIHI